MATPVKKLKAEISALAALFPRDHSRVRIMSSGCDEVVIHFLDGRKKFVIVCSGLVSTCPVNFEMYLYPGIPALVLRSSSVCWFCRRITWKGNLSGTQSLRTAQSSALWNKWKVQN